MSKQNKINQVTNKTICVIEADPALRQRLVSVLQNPSWRVSTFENTPDFLDQLDSNTPDFIINGNNISDVGLKDFFEQLQKKNYRPGYCAR